MNCCCCCCGRVRCCVCGCDGWDWGWWCGIDVGWSMKCGFLALLLYPPDDDNILDGIGTCEWCGPGPEEEVDDDGFFTRRCRLSDFGSLPWLLRLPLLILFESVLLLGRLLLLLLLFGVILVTANGSKSAVGAIKNPSSSINDAERVLVLFFFVVVGFDAANLDAEAFDGWNASHPGGTSQSFVLTLLPWSMVRNEDAACGGGECCCCCDIFGTYPLDKLARRIVFFLGSSL